MGDPIPLPDMVCGQVRSQVLRTDASFRSFGGDLVGLGVPIFGSHFLSGRRIRSLLFSRSRVRPCLPSATVTGRRAVGSVLTERELLFLGPVRNDRNQGVVELDLGNRRVVARLSAKGNERGAVGFGGCAHFMR